MGLIEKIKRGYGDASEKREFFYRIIHFNLYETAIRNPKIKEKRAEMTMRRQNSDPCYRGGLLFY